MRDDLDLLDEDQRLIAEAVRGVCAGFDDDYWAARDREHEFPWDFYRKMAEGGWVGIALPGSTGVAAAGSPTPRSSCTRWRAAAAVNGARRLTIFGLNPIAKFGNDRLKETFLRAQPVTSMSPSASPSPTPAPTPGGSPPAPSPTTGWMADHRSQGLDHQGARVGGGAAHRRTGHRSPD